MEGRQGAVAERDEVSGVHRPISTPNDKEREAAQAELEAAAAQRLELGLAAPRKPDGTAGLSAQMPMLAVVFSLVCDQVLERVQKAAEAKWERAIVARHGIPAH